MDFESTLTWKCFAYLFCNFQIHIVKSDRERGLRK
nr:MAG TPA: hypothetical protein [Caudoviricetes sp.]